MKKLSLISSLLLSSIILVSISSSEANAANTGVIGGDLTSKGTIKVEQGEAGGGEDIKDPENPENPVTPPDDEVTKNDDTGTLIIQAVSNLKFGTVKTGTTKQTINAQATKIDNAGTTRGAYVQWSDLRDSERGYTLTAKLGKQFTKKDDSTKTLKNSTITYNNGIMNSLQDSTQWPEDKMLTSFELKEDGNASTVVTADKTGNKGKGEYFVEYGQSSKWDSNKHAGANKGNASTDNSSVTLTIPAATSAGMVIGDYEADVVWTLAAVK